MSFSSPHWRYVLLAVGCTAVLGCASVPDPSNWMRDPTTAARQGAEAPADAASSPTTAALTPAERAAKSAGSAPAPVAVAAKAPRTELVVAPTAQRAFDDARRALRAGRVEDAERGFRALVQSNPELGGPHANLGLIYRQAGKLPESAAALEKATQASPDQALYFNQLGVTYRHQGQFAKAREAYERAIALDPGYAAPYLNLGILNDLYLQERRRALELYDRYLALSPGGDATVTKWVADMKKRKGDQVMLSLKERE
jgi:tetratricopeptide (TPR) repeat protein